MIERSVRVREASSPPLLIVMGVAGSGKTLIGSRVAARLGWDFRDGDEFHPPENVRKMAAGVALDDADRAPWLAAIGAWLDAECSAGRPALVGASVLKRAYRDTLRRVRAGIGFVYLRLSPETARARVAGRKGHFMPAALVDSQFAILEEPGPDEPAMVIDAAGEPDRVVESVIAGLKAKGW